MQYKQTKALFFSILTTLAIVGAVSGVHEEAQACGGLFCNNSQPVNQSAERIVFVDHGNDRVTAVVEILYEGPSEEFSWMVPVPGIPEVGVSSTHLLNSLQNATNPLYTLNTTIEGECGSFNLFGADEQATAGSDSNFGNNATGNNSGVTVVASGAAGPYDYQVIQVDPDLPNPAQAASMWLMDNGYDVAGPELLQEYLDAGMNFLGFKLQKGNNAGSIRPVTMSYNTDHPMIPIKLTAVAAQDDMGVLVWVTGPYRAAPTNYRHLILNDAAIDWFNPNTTYNNVINLAADEAGGQGFVTEYAGPSEEGANFIANTNSQAQWDAYQRNFDELRPSIAVSNAVDAFSTWSGFIDVLLATGLLEPGNIEGFINCPRCTGIDNNVGADFDKNLFFMMLRDLVVEPVLATERLILEQPSMTRFYSTLSASEMTLDPEFEFNASLAPISNTHTANRIIECSSSYDNSNEAPWRTILPSGQVVRGRDRVWPFALGDLPTNERIQQLSTSGLGDTVTNNRPLIDELVAQNNSKFEEDCSCSTPAAPAPARPWTILGLAAIGLGLLTRKRK